VRTSLRSGQARRNRAFRNKSKAHLGHRDRERQDSALARGKPTALRAITSNMGVRDNRGMGDRGVDMATGIRRGTISNATGALTGMMTDTQN
jgi:hypothetical protein